MVGRTKRSVSGKKVRTAWSQVLSPAYLKPVRRYLLPSTTAVAAALGAGSPGTHAARGSRHSRSACSAHAAALGFAGAGTVAC